MNKANVLVLLVIALFALGALSLYQHIKISGHQEHLRQANLKISQAETQIAKYQSQIAPLNDFLAKSMESYRALISLREIALPDGFKCLTSPGSHSGLIEFSDWDLGPYTTLKFKNSTCLITEQGAPALANDPNKTHKHMGVVLNHISQQISSHFETFGVKTVHMSSSNVSSVSARQISMIGITMHLRISPQVMHSLEDDVMGYDLKMNIVFDFFLRRQLGGNLEDGLPRIITDI